MKKVMSKTTIVIAMIAIFSAAFTNTAMATKVDPPLTEIKYVGSVESNPVFELNLKNYQEDNYFITIRDAAGTVLFSEKLIGTNISRKYRIDTQDELPVGGILFEVRSLKGKKLESYRAGFTENVTREVAVTKL